MAKAPDSAQAEEPVIDESDAVVEEPTVELDRPTEIEGELVENPVLEESDDEGTTESDSVSDGTESEDGDKSDESTEEPSEGDQPTEPAEVVSEKDETGVYNPVTATDPGDFQPKGDYGFEVTTAEGKTVKINTPEEADAFAQRLDNEDNLLTAYQFTQFQRNFLKMDSGIDREKVQYEADKELYETQQAQEQVRTEQITQWSNELKYLQAKDLIPEVPSAIDVPGGWEKNPDNPGVKARLDIFKWMEGENKARAAAGIAEVTSAVDAYQMMKAEQLESGAVEEKQREVSTRQAKGRMVSGNSSFTPTNEQTGSIVGEGGSLHDLVTEFSANQ